MIYALTHTNAAGEVVDSHRALPNRHAASLTLMMLMMAESSEHKDFKPRVVGGGELNSPTSVLVLDPTSDVLKVDLFSGEQNVGQFVVEPLVPTDEEKAAITQMVTEVFAAIDDDLIPVATRGLIELIDSVMAKELPLDHFVNGVKTLTLGELVRLDGWWQHEWVIKLFVDETMHMNVKHLITHTVGLDGGDLVALVKDHYDALFASKADLRNEIVRIVREKTQREHGAVDLDGNEALSEELQVKAGLVPLH